MCAVEGLPFQGRSDNSLPKEIQATKIADRTTASQSRCTPFKSDILTIVVVTISQKPYKPPISMQERCLETSATDQGPPESP